MTDTVHTCTHNTPRQHDSEVCVYRVVVTDGHFGTKRKFAQTHVRMKSPIQLELTAGTLSEASADALVRKSLTESLYSPVAMSLSYLRRLRREGGRTKREISVIKSYLW